jgi:hypothetical protein
MGKPKQRKKAARAAAKKPAAPVKRGRGRPRREHPNGDRLFTSMKQMSGATGIPVPLLKLAKESGCPGFLANRIRESEIVPWIEENKERLSAGVGKFDGAIDAGQSWDDSGEEESTDGVSQDGGLDGSEKGISNAYARVQRMEQVLSKRLNRLLTTKGVPIEFIDKTSNQHLKYSKMMLEMEMKLEQSKKDSGALIPMDEVLNGTMALIAWLNTSFGVMMRPLLPELEGKTKKEMGKISTPIIRGAVLRSLENGIKTGKLPKYIADCAAKMARQSFNLGEE